MTGVSMGWGETFWRPRAALVPPQIFPHWGYDAGKGGTEPAKESG
jgi:hypothetical protein